MNSFIPEEDMPAFEKFLSDNNLISKVPQTADVVPSPPPGEAGPSDEQRPPLPGGSGDTENFVLDLNIDHDNLLTTNF
jgi:hypothetical protein